MSLEIKVVHFIHDKDEFKSFMSEFMELVNKYHEEMNSKSFEFDYTRFVTEWINNKLALAVMYDGDMMVGFTISSVVHNYFDSRPSLMLSHAFILNTHRGDISVIRDGFKLAQDRLHEFGCENFIALASPELMPLIMQSGGQEVLYSGVLMK